MTKRIPLTVFCLLFLLSILCFSNAMGQPEQAESLYATANQYEEARQFDKATSLYGQVHGKDNVFRRDCDDEICL